jgi:hypothetical protein
MMELDHLPYRKGIYADNVGRAGLERRGKKKWQRAVCRRGGSTYRRPRAR